MIQAHIVYSGTVQGVGFRYTTRRFAAELGLAGWVKNLHTGKVEILAEGPKESVEELLVRLDEYFNGHITDKKISYQKSDGTYTSFGIAATT